ncbi:hypothetical protein QG37_07207 [Candidozyma auris]|nr:hypothetical protein QG37_07207 [[Candida] auris]
MNDDIITTQMAESADFLLDKPEYRNAKPGTITQIAEDAMVNNNTSDWLYSSFSVKSFLSESMMQN